MRFQQKFKALSLDKQVAIILGGFGVVFGSSWKVYTYFESQAVELSMPTGSTVILSPIVIQKTTGKQSPAIVSDEVNINFNSGSQQED